MNVCALMTRLLTILSCDNFCLTNIFTVILSGPLLSSSRASNICIRETGQFLFNIWLFLIFFVFILQFRFFLLFFTRNIIFLIRFELLASLKSRKTNLLFIVLITFVFSILFLLLLIIIVSSVTVLWSIYSITRSFYIRLFLSILVKSVKIWELWKKCKYFLAIILLANELTVRKFEVRKIFKRFKRS